MTSWDEVIDVLEANAYALEVVLADPDVAATDILPFVPPDHLGPVPLVLRSRADAVLRRLRVAESELRIRRDVIGQELALVGGATRAPVARYLDTLA